MHPSDDHALASETFGIPVLHLRSLVEVMRALGVEVAARLPVTLR